MKYFVVQFGNKSVESHTVDNSTSMIHQPFNKFDMPVEDNGFIIKFKLDETELTNKFVQAWNVRNVNKSTHRIFVNEYGSITPDVYAQCRRELNQVIENIDHHEWARKNWPIDTNWYIDENTEDRQLDKLNALHRYFEDVSYALENSPDEYQQLYQWLESINQLVHILEKNIDTDPSLLTVLRNSKDEELDLPLTNSDYYRFCDEDQSGVLYLDFGTVGKDLATCYSTNDIELVKNKEVKQQTHIRPMVNFKFNRRNDDQKQIEFNYDLNILSIYDWCKENNLGEYLNYRDNKYFPGRARLGELVDPLTYKSFILLRKKYPYITGAYIEDDESSDYTWNYLNSTGANPLFQQIANFVKENQCNSILDIGCGYSRVNEFLTDYDYNIAGIDTDNECIKYCQDNYPKHNYQVANALSLPTYDNREFDCIILSGILYYFDKNGLPSTDEYVQSLIEKYNPKCIIISEPRPSESYQSPDFIPLLDRWAWSMKNVDMDIRMGNRAVYCLHTDLERPKRKIKAEFNANSENHVHHLQPDFSLEQLKHQVYLTNTEDLSSQKDGELTPNERNIKTYVSVCAGFKSMYKAHLDNYFGKEFQFIYIDVVPQSVDYRMWQDNWLTKSSIIDNGIFDQAFEIYKETVDSRIQPLWGGLHTSIKDAIDEDLDILGISQHDWLNFLRRYSQIPKTYVKLDAVNNCKLLSKLINQNNNETTTWFWHSNIFDWHQFRYKEQSFYAWSEYLKRQTKGLILNGKQPPFTTS
jgi:SAM-dependent methyltransferase